MSTDIIEFNRYKVSESVYRLRITRLRELELALDKVRPIGLFFKIIELDGELEIVTLTDVTMEQAEEFGKFDLKGYEGYRSKIELAIMTAIHKKVLKVLLQDKTTHDTRNYKQENEPFKGEMTIHERLVYLEAKVKELEKLQHRVIQLEEQVEKLTPTKSLFDKLFH